MVSTLGSSDTKQQFKICGDPLIYTPPIGEYCLEALALDIPVLLPLPRELVASGYFGNWNATTIHYLLVRFTGGAYAGSEFTFEESFPVPIKVYDTLPLYRQFNEPVVESRVSADNQVVVDLSLPVSSIGPKDPFTLFAKVAANPLHNRRKKNLQLRSVTLQIREILECYDGGLPPKKERIVIKKTSDCEQLLSTEGSMHEFSFEFPYENDFLQLYSLSEAQLVNTSVNYPSATFNKNRPYGKIAEGIPLTHIQGFTSLGKLFSLRFEVTVKVKINHGKDLEINLPVTVSPYDRVSSDYLLYWIKSQCQIARDKFGKDVVSSVVHCHNYDDVHLLLQGFGPPPKVYKNTRTDWALLGYNPEAFGKHVPERMLVTYID